MPEGMASQGPDFWKARIPVGGGGTGAVPPPPQEFKIGPAPPMGDMVFESAEDGRKLFTILSDGRITIVPGVERDEAAKGFWDAVESLGLDFRKIAKAEAFEEAAKIAEAQSVATSLRSQASVCHQLARVLRAKAKEVLG